MLDGERLDDLQLGNLKIIQKINGYNFTSDSVLLANFVKAKHSDRCVEIGTGCGVISILVDYKMSPKQILAFEFIEECALLSKRNIELNKLEEKIQIINEKIQNYQNFVKKGEIDVVFSNPPYFNSKENVQNKNDIKSISRHEKNLTLKELCSVASGMLKFGGKFFFIYDSSRLAEVIKELKNNNLEPKRLVMVYPTQNKNSNVFLCEAVKGGKENLVVLPPIISNNLDGEYIQTLQKLFGTIKEGKGENI